MAIVVGLPTLAGVSRHRFNILLHKPSTNFQFFKKNGPIPAFFINFRSVPITISKIQIEKGRWCVWDSNPGPQDGNCRQKQGAMAAAHQRHF